MACCGGVGGGWLPRGVLLAVLMLVTACDHPNPPPSPVDVIQALGGEAQAGFERATTVRQFDFPDDHGPHPGFRNEWWYITGHLRDEQHNLYGFQVTFFRIALRPPGQPSPSRASAWAGDQLWMAHAALTDINTGKHRAEERYSRTGPGLAGATAIPFNVWLGDWQLAAARGEGAGDKGLGECAANEHWQLTLDAEDFALALNFTPAKPVVMQGDQGLSQKSDGPGNASYYYSIPRLDTRGELVIGDRHLAVSGLSWLDREWGTSALGADQSGWDWFSLQLEAGQDLMFYRLRDLQGAMHGSSLGSWIDTGASSTVVTPNDIQLTPLQWWQSPTTKKRYPVSWRVTYADADVDWIVRALVADQEMNMAVIYWEGLVEVVEPHTGVRLGLGYLEMTGY